jgi:hypothetical protein
MNIGLFDALGIFVGLYTARAAITGEVFAKSGPWGQTIYREERPAYFWTVIAIYAALAVALFTIF